MKDIGIVVCNYNKEDYIVNCIQSILDSSVQFFDVYVVDNASTDRSVDCIRERFGNRVNLLVNNDNKGGSGGFNTGIREALKHNYKYLLLFDNDIVIDPYAIEELYQFMESHNEVGMVGSKVYFMDYPERIWGYGGMINFETYLQEDNYKNCTDSDDIPEIIYCDYVAACSLMVRTSAVKKVGIMPEKNFIYWDDMEWGYRFNEAGYKVAVWGKSKIWHKAGGRNAGNTFINYYMWRNRIRFFLKVLPADKREHFSEIILTDLFRMIYSCNLKGEENIVKSVMYAFDDAVHGIDGKATDYKILPRNNNRDRVALAVDKSKSVLILFNGDYEGLGNVIRKLEALKTVEQIAISLSDCDENPDKVKEQFPNSKVELNYTPEKYDFHMKMCDHIFKIGADMADDTYIDPWCNIINGKDDMAYCKNYTNTQDIFKLCLKELLINNNSVKDYNASDIS